MRLFILAGEPSGDALGADLVRRLRTRSQVELGGVGGEMLAAEGLQPLFPISDLAVMGWVDVLPRLPLLLWRARQVARAIVAAKPDVVVLVDAQVFSRVVAERVRKAGGSMPILLYVSPAVWAYFPERAKRLGASFDEVLAVLPFEPAVMQQLGGPQTSFVGHPAAATIRAGAVVPERGPLLLLPGSRRGELRRHLPLMKEVGAALGPHPRVTELVIPTIAAVEQTVRAAVGTWPFPVRVVTGESARREALASAVAACAVMGTITLELAMAGVPTVGTYIGDRGQERRVRDFAIRFVSLPNLILGRALIPEVLSAGEAKPAEVIARVRELLDSSTTAGAQRDGFREIRDLMATGTAEHPRADPAERVLAWAGKRSQRSAIGS